MKKMYFALLILGLVMTSCGRSGGSSSKRVKSMCDCMKEAGLDEVDVNNTVDKTNKIDEETQEKLYVCMASVLKDVQKDMKRMKDEKAKSDYTRELMKGFIDSKCADKFFESLPYDKAEELLPIAIKALEKGEDPVFGDDASSEAYSSDGGDYYEDEGDEGDYYEWSEAGTNNCGDYLVRWGGYKGREELDCSGPGCDCR